MSHDPHLMDAIKAHFARKSSAHLWEIVQANNQERWSPEAIAAAGRVLQDRKAGRAQEPQVPEAEPPPPPTPPDPYSLGLLALSLFGGLSGHLHFHISRVDYAGDPDPDLPLPFGPSMAWLALDTTDTEAVAAALDLRGALPATWAEGIKAAYRSSVFVTPPVADWTLAVGTALFPPGRAETFIKPLLERLSREFRDAQYFCTHRDVGLHVWARGRQGQLVRGYGWLGEKGLTLWDEGAQTAEERDLGFRSSDGRSTTGEQAQKENVTFLDEAGVMQLACLWSIDPTTLDRQFKEPLTGLLGTLAWAETQSSRCS